MSFNQISSTGRRLAAAEMLLKRSIPIVHCCNFLSSRHVLRLDFCISIQTFLIWMDIPISIKYSETS